MASTAKFLLEKGADPTRKNKYGTTALHFAARTGNVALTRALLNSPNVNVNETGENGSQVPTLPIQIFICLRSFFFFFFHLFYFAFLVLLFLLKCH